MKVIHFLHYGRGGIPTVVCAQASGAKSAQYKIMALEDRPELHALARNQGLPLRVLHGHLLTVVWRLARALRSECPDIVHTHSFVPRIAMALLSQLRLTRATHVTTYHNDYPYFHETGIRSVVKRVVESMAVSASCKAVICGSREVFNTVARLRASAPPCLRLIYNGIVIADRVKHTSATRSDDAGTVATVGRLSAQKNHSMLLQSWKHVVHHHPGWKLHVIGDGDLAPQLQDLRDRLGLQDSVRLLGWMAADEVRQQLLSSDVFVLTSSYESLPTVILEALSAGLPVVTTRVAGVDDLVEPGVSGYIVDGPHEFVDALDRLLSMPKDARHNMGARGRDHVVARFSASRFACEVEATYAELVSSTRA